MSDIIPSSDKSFPVEPATTEVIPPAAMAANPARPIPVNIQPVPADPVNSYSENPVWSGFDVFVTVVLLLGALLLSTSIAFAIAFFGQRNTGVSAAELAKNPSPQIIVPAMTVSYGFMLACMYAIVTRLRGRRFWEAVSWHWPSRAPIYLIAGGFLAVGLGLLAHYLPIPKSLPMDRFFRDPQSAYLMACFGVAIAPLAEELLFRGFLYPVLDRWLGNMFMTPQRVQQGSLWFVLIAAWGYASHRVPAMLSVGLAIVLFVAIATLFLIRSMRRGGKSPLDVLLPGISLLAWGLTARSLPNSAFLLFSAGLLILAAALAAVGFSQSLPELPASRLGRMLAIVLTAASFAMVHSDQLGRAWAPLLVLFLVGLTLTITRAVSRSVAPGFLMHVGYNLTLFGLMYVATDHFRHMERMAQ